MASFAEYAALARHLHELRRSGERSAAQLAEARGSTAAAADRLDQRLGVQQQRLTALGQMIGRSIPPPAPQPGPPMPPPPPPSWPSPPPVGGYPPPGAPGQPSVPAQYAGPDHPEPLGPPPPSSPPPSSPTSPPSPPFPPSGSDAPGPQRHVYRPTGFGTPAGGGEQGSGVEPVSGAAAYPELPAGPARRALPATPASGAGAGAVPGPRLPFDAATAGTGAAGGPPARPVDPVRELELARQSADGADVMIVQTETMAQQAPLFPSMSPLARATTVYLICAGVLTVIIWIVLTVAEVTRNKGFDAGTLAVFSWSCAGLPTMAFFVGYLVLSVWGKPRMIVGRPARYARLGFLICFLAAPVAFLGYYLV
ncbi:hypothetical protein ACN27G_19675 [Plantactinospora sp. WMMB334]|uniref:hypothetical protein n=1 Tax=Plantactinospora sp. WMMB334 TaxID=3404119 RepID=UPI003B963514